MVTMLMLSFPVTFHPIYKSINCFSLLHFCVALPAIFMGMIGADKPGLTHLSLVHSPGPSVVLCALAIVHTTFTN